MPVTGAGRRFLAERERERQQQQQQGRWRRRDSSASVPAPALGSGVEVQGDGYGRGRGRGRESGRESAVAGDDHRNENEDERRSFHVGGNTGPGNEMESETEDIEKVEALPGGV